MCAVPSMAVFCSSLISCFPGALFRYFLNDFKIVPVASITTGITLVLTYHISCTSVVSFLHFRIFSAPFFITFLSPKIAQSISKHVSFSLSRIMMTGLFLEMILSVCTCCFHSMVTLPFWLVSTDFGTCWYQCCFSNFISLSMHMSKCSWTHTHSIMPIIINIYHFMRGIYNCVPEPNGVFRVYSVTAIL